MKKWNPAAGKGGDGGRETKTAMDTIPEKNRVIRAVAGLLSSSDSFLVAGHKDPDEDCVSSMVAFALLASKFGKRASIVLGPSVQGTYTYLLKICRYNSISILRDGPLPPASVLVFVDTPKPEMIDRPELYTALLADPSVPKLELDHHLGADSSYIGDPGLRLVYEASSTCQIIGHLALKLDADSALLARHEIDDLLSRNLVLAVISGMIADSQNGRFLRSARERWFYGLFSSLFERLLARKTRLGSGNFSSKEEVYEVLAALSEAEDECFRYLSRHVVEAGKVRYAVLDPEESRTLFATWGNDTVVTVAKALVDSLAETGGYLGLVGYYDDPANSPFAQFRLRRSQAFTGLDLRDSLQRLGMANGGGHPGAVGFRVEAAGLADIREAAAGYVKIISAMVEETLGRKP